MPSRLSHRSAAQPLTKGSPAGHLAKAKLDAMHSANNRLADGFQAAHAALDKVQHASSEELLTAGFRQATLASNGVQESSSLDRMGLGQVVFEYQGPNGPVREAGLLGSVYQNHLTLLQGPDLQPRQFINTFARQDGVPFKAIYVRDAGLENLKGWDARRLIAGETPSVAWFHYPAPDSGEPRFIFGTVTPGPERYTITTPDGREFQFHPDFLDELAKNSNLSASPLRGELPRIPVSREAPTGGVIGGKRPDKSTPYTAPPSEQQNQVHDRLTRELFNGEIELEHSLHFDVVWKVKLKNVDPVTGEVRVSDAVMKARVPGDKRTWTAPDDYQGYGRTPMEYVGYFINRLLRMDVVQPVAYRRGLNLQLPNGQMVTEAALLHYIPELKTSLSDLPISSDAKVLANVIRDPDLNVLNYGSGVHWVDGKTHDVKLDLSAAGSRMHGIGGGSPGVDGIRRSVYEALKSWRVEDLQPLVDAEFISAREAESYIENGAAVVRRIDALVEQARQNGVDVATIITPD